MICVSLARSTKGEALRAMAEAKGSGADIVEIRADYLADLSELPDIIRSRCLPVLVTVRSRSEGGRWSRGEDDRAAVLAQACAAGAEWVDEESCATRGFPLCGAKVVLSTHDFEGIPPDLERRAAEMQARGPAVVKIAVTPRTTRDLIRCVRLQRELGGAAAVVAMGEFGEPLRILSSRYGGALTFASPAAGEETGPGQLPIGEMVGRYRVESVDGETAVYAVVGFPVRHSQGPRFFNEVFRHFGVNARYVRIPLDEAASLRPLIEAMGLRGVSVTLPHKEAAAGIVDEREASAEQIGAVNTVVASGERLLGFNTDVRGAVEALEEASTGGLARRRVLVLGAGGVARAIVWGLVREGAEVTVTNRTEERAEALAASFACRVLPWDRRGEAAAEIVVNATRVGMGGDESPFPRDRWRATMLAFDSVYTPRRTRFLEEARGAGARTVDGVELFLRQADHQVRHFLGRPVPKELLIL